MKKLCFLLLCLFILSCKKESQIMQSSKSDRLVFKDYQEYHETNLMLSKMTSLTDLQFWAQEKRHSTLLLDQDTTLADIPPSIKTILNKDSEFQIGDSIVWFHSGNLYTYAKDATYIEDLKTKPDAYRRSGRIFTSACKIRRNTDITMNSVHSEFQYQFERAAYQPCGGTLSYGGGHRKWVTELRDATTQDGMTYHSILYLVIKLEWKVSSWKESQTEQRAVSYNLNGTVTYILGSQSEELWLNFPSGDFSCPYYVLGNLWIPESSCSGSNLWYQPYWNVNLSGEVTQHLNGDTNPPYYTPIYW